MFSQIRRDIQAVFDRDPAARSITEVLLCYSGLHAIWWHRIANRCWHWGLPLTARVISQLARLLTGIEIHPAAVIGEGLFIDHGMGVVVGETAEVGRNVTLFQGVTLGGTGKEKGKRHPTIGDNVMIGAGAKVLGSFTVGENALIGSNAVVLQPLPSNSTAVGVPAEVVRLNGKRPQPLEHDKLPDPVHECLVTMKDRVEVLEQRIRELEAALERQSSNKIS
ncbi:MAG TPA: serine O-acetyltransferase [Armatimonadota bacterium]|nr:serine O-acetyltransferase [Armatimonadota bacterium]